MSTAATKAQWTEGALTAALRAKFAAPEFAFFSQVCNATGARHTRTADGLAMSCWPSRGLGLYGFEIKVSRQDWLTEKANPAKAEAICKYCDFWYIVAAPKVVLDGELPPTWGLIEPRGDNLVIKREAPKLDPQPVTRSFLAAILRRAADAAVSRDVEADIARARNDGYKAGHDAGSKGAELATKRLTDEIEGLRRTIRDFEEASGFQINRFTNTRKMGEAIRFVMNSGLTTAAEHLRNVENMAHQILRSVEATRDMARIAQEEMPIEPTTPDPR